jgi:predicted transcriptional regulator
MIAIKRIEKDLLNGTVFGAVKEATIKRLKKILCALDEMSFLNISQLVVKSGIPRRTLQRDLALLKKNRLVVFKGFPKTGGYVLTEKGKKITREIID